LPLAVIGAVSDAMHALNVKVSVCGGTFQPMWNYPLLAKTSLDYVMDMET
jgi:hypothetical protein